MNVAKTAIATMALVSLFSATAHAEFTGADIERNMDSFLAQAADSSNPVFKECVNEKFIKKTNGKYSELWQDLHKTAILATAQNLVVNDETFSMLANDFVQQYCGDSQLAGGGKKSK